MKNILSTTLRTAGLLWLAIWLGACVPACAPSFPQIDPDKLTQDQSKTLATLQKLDDYPLYTMTYYGDYSDFLKLKSIYYKELGLPKPVSSHCTTFATLNPDGETLLARNNDNTENPVLLLFTKPSNGYASVTLVDIGAFGFTIHDDMKTKTLKSLTSLLFAPYFVSDGMNECGLTIGEMTVLECKTSFDPQKENMFQNEAARYLLDHAGNTKEAVALLDKINVSFPSYPGHFLIADASGNSAVVEWVEGKMEVIQNSVPWQAATNFMLYGSDDKIKDLTDEFNLTGRIANDINGRSYLRYVTVCETLKKADGKMTANEAMQLLGNVSLVRSQEIWFPTEWSVVYMRSGAVQVAMGRNYAHIIHSKLEMKTTQ